jgi:hypothetical protein
MNNTNATGSNNFWEGVQNESKSEDLPTCLSIFRSFRGKSYETSAKICHHFAIVFFVSESYLSGLFIVK